MRSVLKCILTILPTILISCICLFSGCKSTSHNFYVSPKGSDNNPGTKSAPFATLSHAINEVRVFKTGSIEKMPINVFLRDGLYSIDEPILFTPADSGTADAPITYASYHGENVVISGGKKLSGEWKTEKRKPYWKLEIPEAAGRKLNFFSLFVDGESRTRARTPNWGEKVLRAAGREPGGDPRQALQYCDNDVDPSWTNPTDIDVVLLCSWTPTIHRITEIIPENKAIRFISTHSRNVDFWETNFRYYLSNIFEALDQPGEWYLNRDSGTLYYYPMPGENPNQLEFIVPVMKSNMLQFNADLARKEYIKHIHFNGLSFKHLDGDMDRHNGVYRQGHMYLTSAVVANGLQNATLKRCTFSQLGEYALELADGCSDVTIEQCHFWDIGAGAIQVGVTDLGMLQKPVGDNPLDEHGCSPERKVRNILIQNNYIHKLGNIWHGCYGIVNRFASFSRIIHNEIFDIHWDAIGLDARWTWKGYKYSEGTEVAYNHLHNLGLGYHTDAAGVYQFGPLDTHIHHNLIHDAVAYPYICGYAGLYLDEQSRYALVENNLVYNTDWYAMFLHKGVDNIFRNNLCAFSRDGLIARGSRNDTWKANYMDAYRNIYITTNNIMLNRDWDDGDRPPLINSNLYHSFSAETNLIFGNGTFAEWQKRGRDVDSVIAESGCKDPLNFDFSLTPKANASKTIGFIPFDREIKKAGLNCDKSWIKLPGSYTPRKPTKTWTRLDLLKFASFELDFNKMTEGKPPTGIRQQTDKDAGFFVTREVAGIKGPACLKAIDRASLQKSFYPYLIVDKLRKLDLSPVIFTIAVMQPKKDAGPMHLEFRGHGSTQDIGPSIGISKEGKIVANDKPIGTAEPGEWTHLTIEFGLKDEWSGSYKLTLKNKEGSKDFTLPFKHKSFKEVSWIGIMANGTEDSCFYLDNLTFKFGK